jgi:hypothetical protein
MDEGGSVMLKRIVQTLLLFGFVSILPALFAAAQAGGGNWQG